MSNVFKKILPILTLTYLLLPPIYLHHEVISEEKETQNEIVDEDVEITDEDVETIDEDVGTTSNAKYEKQYYRSTWIWHSEDITSNQEELITFLIDQNVTRVYIQIHPSLPLTAYKEFLAKLKVQNIEAYALDGGPDWIYSLENVKKLVEWLTNYHAFAGQDAHFKGVQLDIEPYLTDGWKNDKELTISTYQYFIREAGYLIKEISLPYEVAIPFWFDGTDTEEMSLAEWVIKYSDRTVIMAYRDKASGKNGILSLSSDEIKLAEKYNKKISVGVETRKEKEHTHISFYEEGAVEMEKVLEEVHAFYKHSSSYEGEAIHDYRKWKNLTER
ncbi:hypothetical protein CIB95_02065 [Lottiidibacillus patelloidae]|uniref:Amidase n=1 Tax=Lottiidibacillus patelloidae TaxID=2670334 RepID=A0A263BXR7_9BACI|nr:hypothetical protein [Lottiidibacillus patelloidae]OZM58378.1 hypothetical protein CIB95_02065 [Lottiidibacillus patelloidae]